VTPDGLSDDERLVSGRRFAGLIWGSSTTTSTWHAGSTAIRPDRRHLPNGISVRNATGAS